MLKEKKLYAILAFLLVFALIGEQPKLKEDLRRTSTRLVRVLQVDEVLYGWHSLVDNAGQLYRGLSDRLVNRVFAAQVHTQPIMPAPATPAVPAVLEKANEIEQNNLQPAVAPVAKCRFAGHAGKGC